MKNAKFIAFILSASLGGLWSCLPDHVKGRTTPTASPATPAAATEAPETQPFDASSENWNFAPNDLGEAADQLPSSLAAYKADKLPFSESDLPKQAHLDDEMNAVTYLRSASQKLEAIQRGPVPAHPPISHTTPVPGHPDSVIAEAPASAVRTSRVTEAEFLRAVAATPETKVVFELLDVALRQPHVAFGKSFFYGFGGDAVTGIRHLVQLCGAKAEERAKAGDAAQAAKFLNEGSKISELFLRDRTRLGIIDACYCFADNDRSVDLCASDLFIPSSTQSSRGSALNQFEVGLDLRTPTISIGPRLPYDLVSAVKSCLQWSGSSQSADGELTFASYTSNSPELGDQLPVSRVGRANLARLLQFWADHRDIFSQIDRNPDSAASKFDADLAKCNLKGRSYQVVALTAPALNVMSRNVRRIKLRREADLLLLAGLNFQGRLGHWPKTLAEIKDENLGPKLQPLLADLFNPARGQDLRMFSLKSSGQNFQISIPSTLIKGTLIPGTGIYTDGGGGILASYPDLETLRQSVKKTSPRT
jgi:hypothetical protein